MSVAAVTRTTLSEQPPDRSTHSTVADRGGGPHPWRGSSPSPFSSPPAHGPERCPLRRGPCWAGLILCLGGAALPVPSSLLLEPWLPTRAARVRAP